MLSANYIEETTTSIAGTLGDGAVTLTARTNRPRVSTVLTSTYVGRYVIEDTVNKKFESGIGSFVSNVLTRTKPLVTWDGTTYKNTGTVASIQFGSAPTSGNVIIRLAALSESMGAVMDGRNYTVAGDATWRDYPYSSHYQFTNGAGTAQNLVAATEYYTAYKQEQGGILFGIQYNVATAVAAKSIKVALYDIGTNGLPNNKIVDFVTTSAATTGVKTDTAIASWTPATGIFLTPGWYAIGFISDGAIALIGSSPGSNVVGQNPFGKKNVYGYGNTVYVAGNFTTGLPATANVTAGSMSDPATATNPSSTWFGLKIT